jgi:hypothetical protein
MANPTTHFGWVMPTATDLVTDLPADFNVFGQGVDTSLQDLLGGTTGQVLSKASNTNMDFAWIAQDDSNAIQNAIVDAKGDLIAATAADTPARLAVGTNNQVLTADSSTATGLKWATPATSSSGLTLIQRSTVTAAADTGTTFDGVFSSTYGAYLVVMESVVGSVSNADLLVQGMYSGSTQNADYQGYAFGYAESGSLLTAATPTGSTSAKLGKCFTSNNSYSMLVTGVGVAGNRIRLDTSGWTAQNGGGYKGFMSALQDRTYTGFKISLSTGNITTTTAVYGLASA